MDQAPPATSPAPSPEEEKRRHAIIDLARAEHQEDGKLEIDEDAKLSEGDDNGAWVQAWVWVDFSGSEFDQDGFDRDDGGPDSETPP